MMVKPGGPVGGSTGPSEKSGPLEAGAKAAFTGSHLCKKQGQSFYFLSLSSPVWTCHRFQLSTKSSISKRSGPRQVSNSILSYAVSVRDHLPSGIFLSHPW